MGKCYKGQLSLEMGILMLSILAVIAIILCATYSNPIGINNMITNSISDEISDIISCSNYAYPEETYIESAIVSNLNDESIQIILIVHDSSYLITHKIQYINNTIYNNYNITKTISYSVKYE